MYVSVSDFLRKEELRKILQFYFFRILRKNGKEKLEKSSKEKFKSKKPTS